MAACIKKVQLEVRVIEVECEVARALGADQQVQENRQNRCLNVERYRMLLRVRIFSGYSHSQTTHLHVPAEAFWKT